MELKEAIQSRRSIRGYLDQGVSREIIHAVLELASRAVSSVNCQPWEFAVMTGDVLKKVCDENIACLHEGAPVEIPEIHGFEGPYRKRQVEIGKALLQSMDIAREDKEQRKWWGERGYRFFDAPVGILVYMDTSLDEGIFRFEIGCITQNIALAAMEYGLATCVANQPAMYQRGMHKYLGIPENKKAAIGIALGYPDWTFPANQVISTREDVNQLTKWYGFN